MINVIINFIKNLFISEGEKPTKVITQTQKEIQDMPILDTFEEIIDKVIEHEGGYVNDPDDPGERLSMVLPRSQILMWTLRI